MDAIEDIKAEIVNKPSLKQLLEEQLNYFFKLWLQEKIKERTIRSMTEENKRFIFQAVILQSISDAHVNLISSTLTTLLSNHE